MTDKFCVFLRGINVNGIKIKMDDLKAAFINMGFNDVETVLATGNVIIKDSQIVDTKKLKHHIEENLSDFFNYDAYVFIRSFYDIFKVVEKSKTITVPENFHMYYLLCSDTSLINELEQLFDSLSHEDNELFYKQLSDAFWIVEKGSTLKSEFGSKILGSKKFKPLMTSRNMNTIFKIYNNMAK